jgi:putative membrane protein
MIRTIAITAALATWLVALPALAETPATTPGASTEASPAPKGNLFTEQQAREHLSHLGYTGISDLTKDENGVWRGSATKDGNTRTVAVDVKGAVAK